MNKYVLHGGYTREKNDLNSRFFGEITKGLEIVLLNDFEHKVITE